MRTWQTIRTWLDTVYLGNPLWVWAAAAATALVALLALVLARRLVARYLTAWSERPGNRFGAITVSIIRGTRIIFMIAVALLAASYVADLGAQAVALRRVIVVIAIIQGAVWAVALLTNVLDVWRSRRAGDPSAATLIGTAHVITRIAIWSVALMLVLDNLGVELTTLVASLGIGGIAAALAVQSILGDLFASVSIVLDKPFEVGDFIIVGDLMGTVEHVGLKSTRVRSLSGEQLVFSNGDLLASRIRNFKRMQERRVAFTVRVSTDTPVDALAAIPGMLRACVEAQKEVRFDRSHFAQVSDSALVFEVVYYVKRPDHNLYMDIQQEVNLAVLRSLDNAGIALASPSQTIYLERRPAPAAP
jgi:small-conductance mechanosensitive channel